MSSQKRHHPTFPIKTLPSLIFQTYSMIFHSSLQGAHWQALESSIFTSWPTPHSLFAVALGCVRCLNTPDSFHLQHLCLENSFPESAKWHGPSFNSGLYSYIKYWKRSWCCKNWKQEEKEMTEDEMVGWQHWLDEHEFEQAQGARDGQGSLVCCSPWGRKESDMTEPLNWTELKYRKFWETVLNNPT